MSRDAAMQSATLALTLDLLARPSITPRDDDCQAVLRQRLEKIGFVCETLVYGEGSTGVNAQVVNLWAIKKGMVAAGKTLVFAGHTDVVPPGNEQRWDSPPFVPTIKDGILTARGASDMKTSLAAMVVACEEFVAQNPRHSGQIAFLLTSDEEGPSLNGTAKVVEELRQRGQHLDYCIVGEPTCVDRLGDTIKNGRRGSLSGRLTVIGIQGHVAYPHRARNPVHQVAPALAQLAATVWDEGNEHFPPTTWQVSNIHAGTGAGNIIPGEVVIDFNFRFSTASTPDGLKERVCAILDKHGLQYTLDWVLGGQVFLTPEGDLCRAVQAAIASETQVQAELSTSGGTSDGRFIATICPQVVEFGPPNRSIHKVNEHIALTDIEPLKNVYRRCLENLLA